MGIYVTSDLHFNHKNILRLCRPQFKTIEEHNEYIIESFNGTVGKDDLVYVLGDVGFTPASGLVPLVRALNGRKILLIGNHDVLKDNEYLAMGFIQVCRSPIYYSSTTILSHIPVQEALNNPYVINVHGHIHRGSLTLPNFINANVEINDYKPLDLRKIDAAAHDQCTKSRYAPYGQEWYAQFEHHPETQVNLV